MNRRTLFTLVLVGAALAVLAAWLIWRPPLVRAAVVQERALVRTLLFSARVASASRVELGSTLTGRVEQVAVLEGAEVQRGAVLLRLESDELRANLAQARASERQASARLSGLTSTGRGAAQAGEAQADAVLRAAKAELQRTQDLVARGFLSAARLDDAKRAAEIAQAQRASAQAQARANADRGTDVMQAQAQLALARAAVAAAQVRLDQASITAPANARVLLRSVEPGQIVQPGRALLTLALASPVELVGQVDERYLEQLQVGQTATVSADAYPQFSFAATVGQIAPVVDAQRGAVEVKLAVTQAVPAFLREDMTLSIEVITGQRERARVVPIEAIHGGASVYVLSDGRVEQRAVKLGLSALDAAEIVDGLAAGDVVLLGSGLSPGTRARADMQSQVPSRTVPGRQGSKDNTGGAMGSALGR